MPKTSLFLSASRWFAAIIVMAPLTCPGRIEGPVRRNVLGIIIAGIPDFRLHVEIVWEETSRHATRRPGVGRWSVPDGGSDASGALANKLYRQYGRDIMHPEFRRRVAVDVSEYSPVYVSGDVSKPGAYPFRPGITIRQAIAIAGGILYAHRGRSRFAGG